MMVKVTEEVRKNIEVRLKESAEFQTQLEKKLMEVEKEKQELQDDKRKAIESMEQQVNEIITILIFLYVFEFLKKKHKNSFVTIWFISIDIEHIFSYMFHFVYCMFMFSWNILDYSSKCQCCFLEASA